MKRVTTNSSSSSQLEIHLSHSHMYILYMRLIVAPYPSSVGGLRKKKGQQSTRK